LLISAIAYLYNFIVDNALMKSWFSFSNIFPVILLMFAAALFFRPGLKGAVLRGLSEVGFFQPSVPKSDGELKPIQSLDGQREILFRVPKGS